MTACAVVPEPAPAVDPISAYLAEADYTPQASEISPDEEQLCLPGGDRAPACEDSQALRWSLPLEGEYMVQGTTALYHLDTGARGNDWDGDGSLLATATEAGLLYAENSLLRLVDIDTGEILWRKDLREEEIDFLHSGLWSVYTTGERVLLRFGDGLVQISPEDRDITAVFPLPECTDGIERATEHEVVVQHCWSQGETYSGLDLDTGEVMWDYRDHVPDGVAEGPVQEPASVRVNWVEDGPFSAVEFNSDGIGPLGLGTIGLTSTRTMAFAVACAPDGVGQARPDSPVPGVPCTKPRLYAVNNG